MSPNSDWRSRGYLPHYDPPGGCRHIVFRLNDPLPPPALAHVASAPLLERSALVEAALDVGFGSRALAEPGVAAMVARALAHFDGERYRLGAWCIMPNHVHLLVERFPAWPIASLVHSWKSFTAHRCAAKLPRGGRFWAREYFDRAMRTDDQLERAAAYIVANPVAAGLTASPDAWRWSSAHARAAGE